MEATTYDSPLAFVGIQAALLAGQVLKKGFGTGFSVSSKSSPLNLVTEYDGLSEKAIIDFIRLQFPDHAFLAEESGSSNTNGAPVTWIIDPLDGTMNFAHYIPIFTVSIAALVENEVTVGITYQPMTQELFVAQKGRGAYLNGSPLQVSKVSDVSNAIGSTGFPYDQSEKRERSIEQMIRFLDLGNPMRIIGSATLNLAYIASGRFDIYWGGNLSPWDVAAGKLLVEEAGGRVTHYDGSPHNMFERQSTFASNGLLHETILPLLS